MCSAACQLNSVLGSILSRGNYNNLGGNNGLINDGLNGGLNDLTGLGLNPYGQNIGGNNLGGIFPGNLGGLNQVNNNLGALGLGYGRLGLGYYGLGLQNLGSGYGTLGLNYGRLGLRTWLIHDISD